MTTIPSAAESAKTLALLGSDHTDVPTKLAMMNTLRPALLALFKKVESPTNWKAPINTIVYLNADELALLPYAIEFFTATPAKITSMPLGGYHVMSVGYAAGPAGDH